MTTRKNLRTRQSAPDLRDLVRLALAEDIGPGDVTSALFAQHPRREQAIFLAKQPGTMSGGEVVREVFRQLDAKSRLTQLVADGEDFFPGSILLRVQGRLDALLSGERTALNFLQRLCGIATLTRRYVEALGEARSRIGIYDTRKTTPLWRAIEKKAVRDGGGCNHRFGLFDMIMLKNNHIDMAGGIAAAVRRLIEKGTIPKKKLPLCVEARNVEEAVEALAVGADIIMLDNIPIGKIRSCIATLTRKADAWGMAMPQIEISGGVTINDVRRLRHLPIQRISVGSLTHSAPAIDISMRLEPRQHDNHSLPTS